MKTNNLFFYVQYIDGTSEAVKVSCTKGMQMLKEIQLEKSKAKYAALIKE